MANGASMIPRERVLRSLGHKAPDRPAFSWSFGPQPAARRDLDAYLSRWGLDYARLYCATSDIRRLDVRYIGLPLQPNRSYWGWSVKPMSYGAGSYDEFDYQPLSEATQVQEIACYSWPDPAHFDYESLAGDIARVDPGHRFARVLWIGNPLESVQQVLPCCSPDQVRREVRRLKQVLGEGGGYICAPSHAIQAGTPPENVVAMVEEAVGRPISEIAD